MYTIFFIILLEYLRKYRCFLKEITELHFVFYFCSVSSELWLNVIGLDSLSKVFSRYGTTQILIFGNITLIFVVV